MNTRPRSELILGGQKSGKTVRAEQLAAQWLAQAGGHQALYLATAQPADEEMRQRIDRHRADRARRVPGMATVEAQDDLAAAIARHSQPGTLLVVDCLTLWLTGLIAPMSGPPQEAEGPTEALVAAIAAAPGPLVLVSNEIGLGVIPMGREVRQFVDALGRLNQRVASACERVTLMAAGLPLFLKGA